MGTEKIYNFSSNMEIGHGFYLFIYLNLRKGEIQCLTVNKLFTVMVQGTHENIYTYLKVLQEYISRMLLSSSLLTCVPGTRVSGSFHGEADILGSQLGHLHLWYSARS